MENTTMTTHARSCVLSARPRTAGVLLASGAVQGQGTTVSIVGPVAVRRVLGDAPFMGDISRAAVADFPTTYKTPDVVRSRSGRPPV